MKKEKGSSVTIKKTKGNKLKLLLSFFWLSIIVFFVRADVVQALKITERPDWINSTTGALEGEYAYSLTYNPFLSKVVVPRGQIWDLKEDEALTLQDNKPHSLHFLNVMIYKGQRVHVRLTVQSVGVTDEVQKQRALTVATKPQRVMSFMQTTLVQNITLPKGLSDGLTVTYEFFYDEAMTKRAPLSMYWTLTNPQLGKDWYGQPGEPLEYWYETFGTGSGLTNFFTHPDSLIDVSNMSNNKRKFMVSNPADQHRGPQVTMMSFKDLHTLKQQINTPRSWTGSTSTFADFTTNTFIKFSQPESVESVIDNVEDDDSIVYEFQQTIPPVPQDGATWYEELKYEVNHSDGQLFDVANWQVTSMKPTGADVKDVTDMFDIVPNQNNTASTITLKKQYLIDTGANNPFYDRIYSFKGIMEHNGKEVNVAQDLANNYLEMPFTVTQKMKHVDLSPDTSIKIDGLTKVNMKADVTYSYVDASTLTEFDSELLAEKLYITQAYPTYKLRGYPYKGFESQKPATLEKMKYTHNEVGLLYKNLETTLSWEKPNVVTEKSGVGSKGASEKIETIYWDGKTADEQYKVVIRDSDDKVLDVQQLVKSSTGQDQLNAEDISIPTNGLEYGQHEFSIGLLPIAANDSDKPDNIITYTLDIKKGTTVKAFNDSSNEPLVLPTGIETEYIKTIGDTISFSIPEEYNDLLYKTIEPEPTSSRKDGNKLVVEYLVTDTLDEIKIYYRPKKVTMTIKYLQFDESDKTSQKKIVDDLEKKERKEFEIKEVVVDSKISEAVEKKSFEGYVLSGDYVAQQGTTLIVDDKVPAVDFEVRYYYKPTMTVTVPKNLNFGTRPMRKTINTYGLVAGSELKDNSISVINTHETTNNQPSWELYASTNGFYREDTSDKLLAQLFFKHDGDGQTISSSSTKIVKEQITYTDDIPLINKEDDEGLFVRVKNVQSIGKYYAMLNIKLQRAP